MSLQLILSIVRITSEMYVSMFRHKGGICFLSRLLYHFTVSAPLVVIPSVSTEERPVFKETFGRYMLCSKYGEF